MSILELAKPSGTLRSLSTFSRCRKFDEEYIDSDKVNAKISVA